MAEEPVKKPDTFVRWIIGILFLIVGYLISNEHRMTVVESGVSQHDRALSALYNKIDNIDIEIKTLIGKEISR